MDSVHMPTVVRQRTKIQTRPEQRSEQRLRCRRWWIPLSWCRLLRHLFASARRLISVAATGSVRAVAASRATRRKKP